MTGRVATIVRCADLVRHVYPTVDAIERQRTATGEIVLAIDDTTPPSAQDWLQQLARRRKYLVVSAASPRPGAVWNAGIRATKSPYVMCTDAGDRVDSRFHEMGSARLDSDHSVHIVSSWVHVFGPGPEARILIPDGADLDALIADAGAIHGASIFRRAVWQRLRGF